MREFLLKTFLLGATVTVSFGLYLSQADGYTDPFYKRFTSKKQRNLILGTSRSAQGIVPHILDSVLNDTFYNYSFTIGHSSYGPAYLKSIKKKLKQTNDTEAVFILSIDPWSISSPSKDPNDENLFPENNRLVGTTIFVNTYPNFEYLIREYQGKYKDLTKKSKKMVLHDDGWLEVKINIDSLDYAEKVEKKAVDYERNATIYKFSNTRVLYLIETIMYLKQYGKVYLVRLPIDPVIFEIENQYIPDFQSRIQTAIAKSDGFLDLTSYNSSYRYTDGNHLWKESGKDVTLKIATWIAKQNSMFKTYSEN